MKPWYAIDNIDEIDTPALVIFPDRVKENIQILKRFLPDVDRLRPHVKTNKSSEASALMISSGINKFKCATIAEAEMLGLAGAKDVLLAYQPVGPKANRLLQLQKKYTTTRFSCLIDNLMTARELSGLAINAGHTIEVYIDLNVGMNRTGIDPEKATDLFTECLSLKGISVIGLHAYDGHIRETNLAERTRHCDESFSRVEALKQKIEKTHSRHLTIIAGGTPTFPIHSKRPDVECSPGTFIYWDMGYQRVLPDEPFVFAALVISRVISKPFPGTICADLGHKSIASENPLDSRVSFLNAPGLQPTGHSEEHMVFHTPSDSSLEVGDILYGVPYHICPTCALYDSAWTVVNNSAVTTWNIPSRKKTITV